MNQCSSAKEFMEKVKYSFDLTNLYKVEASCQYTESMDFCPVLVKIMDEDIKKLNNNYNYLL